MFKRAIVCGALLGAVGVYGQSKKHTPVPAIVTTARYVAIVPLNANSKADWFNESSVSAEDRQIADSVLNALHAWGKYRYTIDPGNADIVIAVRAGRAADATVGPRYNSGGMLAGRGPQGHASVRPSLSLDSPVGTGPKDDTMAIFVSASGDSAPLWIRSKSRGLQGTMPLFDQFRKDVEKSEQTIEKKP